MPAKRTHQELVRSNDHVQLTPCTRLSEYEWPRCWRCAQTSKRTGKGCVFKGSSAVDLPEVIVSGHTMLIVVHGRPSSTAKRAGYPDGILSRHRGPSMASALSRSPQSCHVEGRSYLHDGMQTKGYLSIAPLSSAYTTEHRCEYPLTYLTGGDQPSAKAWYPQKV